MCETCNSPFCVCVLRDGSADLSNLEGIFAALRRMMPPEAQELDVAKLPPPDIMAKLLTDPRSPLRAPHGEIVSWLRRLCEATSSEPPEDADVEATWRSLAEHVTMPGHRILDALGLIVEYNELLDEEDPDIGAHRAWMLDQVFRILAGDHYLSIRTTFQPTYNEGVEPIDPLEGAPPSEPAN
jgi:hypothetical protein